MKLANRSVLRPLLSSRSHLLRHIVIDWNNRFPVDYWWRQHHGVAFGSAEHKQMTFLNMAFEYIEWVEFRILEIEQKLADKRDADIKNSELFSQTTEGSRVVSMSKKEIDQVYDELDLSQFDSK